MRIFHLHIPNLARIFVFCFAAILARSEITPEEAASLVILDAVGEKNLGIEIVEAEETEFEETVFALGRIQAAPAGRAIVSSRVPGRVVSVAAHVDTRIRMSSEALVIESRQPGTPPPQIRIPAPINGIVSKVNAVEGQPVEPTDSLIEILDLSTVHAIAAVPEHLAAKLKSGLKARIRVIALDNREFTAELAHIGAEVDSKNGTIEAAFHIPNEEYELRPGMRAEFSIVTSKRENILSVPRSALQGDTANRVVYRRHYDTGLKHTFVRMPVQVGAVNDQSAEIVSGLAPGDEVVTKGAFSLGFAGKGNVSLKDALDAAHGHPHNEDGSEMTPEQLAAAKGKTSGGSGQRAFTPLAIFFAATTALLLVLLLVSGLHSRSRNT
jgi:multidrug efflux pump subunit AcrA (membrane-fusion protein)